MLEFVWIEMNDCRVAFDTRMTIKIKVHRKSHVSVIVRFTKVLLFVH